MTVEGLRGTRRREPVASRPAALPGSRIGPLLRGRPLSKGRVLGPLELKVLEALWRRGCASTVRQLRTAFPRLAYTTLMTTADRLHRNGLLRRSQLGLAFSYEPVCSRKEVLGEMFFGPLTELFAGSSSNAPPLLSTLVHAVGSFDAKLLDQLEALACAERMRLKLSLRGSDTGAPSSDGGSRGPPWTIRSSRARGGEEAAAARALLPLWKPPKG